jgi:sulfate transporter 4
MVGVGGGGAAGLTLLLFTRLFYYAPMCVLASIVISAVFSLVDYEEPLFLYKVAIPFCHSHISL